MTGCETSRGFREIEGAKLGNYVEFRSLSRNQYTVRGNVVGKAQFVRTRVLFPFSPFTSFTFGRLGLTDKTNEGVIHGFPGSFTPLSPLDYTKEQAVYNALEKIPDADLLLQPRFSWKCKMTQYFFGSSETCTVTVKGKAISINEG